MDRTIASRAGTCGWQVPTRPLSYRHQFFLQALMLCQMRDSPRVRRRLSPPRRHMHQLVRQCLSCPLVSKQPAKQSKFLSDGPNPLLSRLHLLLLCEAEHRSFCSRARERVSLLTALCIVTWQICLRPHHDRHVTRCSRRICEGSRCGE